MMDLYVHVEILITQLMLVTYLRHTLTHPSAIYAPDMIDDEN